MDDYNSSYTGNQIDTAIGAALSPDSSPASGSSALITSGGVYTALGDKADKAEGIHYGSCSTGASTQIKVVTISSISYSTLADIPVGLSIRVKFTSGQSYNGQPQINLNSLGAVGIKRKGDTGTGYAAARYEWLAGEIIDFCWDGSNWVIINGGIATTTYYGYTKLSSSTSSTSTSVAATPSAVKEAYDLANGKQDAITASGILKGDGAGAVSAAAAGTDYQAPLVAGTDYATPAMIPSVPSASNATPRTLGTASAGASGDYSRADHVHQKPTYSKSDVGLGNVANVLQYSASNPPPAGDVSYDDTATSFNVDNVQDAIDKIVETINAIDEEVVDLDIGKQAAITATGILKGNGVWGIGSAVAGTDYQTPLTAGTDYQTPLTAGTDYATPAMIPSVPSASDASPQMDGTAAAGSSTDYSRADHVHPLDSTILKNKANNATSLSIMGGSTPSGAGNMVAIGSDAWSGNSGDIAIGKSSNATGVTSIALGFQASATAANAVQIGAGTNADANTVKVGYRTLGTNYELLDANGIIPVGRMPYTFDTAPTQDSTNPVTSGGVYTAIRDRNARADSIFSTVTEITSGGITITPTDDWAGYSYLAITLNTSSTNPAAERLALVVPVVLIQYSNWFPVARNGIYGAVQVGRVSNSSQLTFKTDLTSLYVVNVRRVK